MLLCCAEAVYKYVNGIFTPLENVPREFSNWVYPRNLTGEEIFDIININLLIICKL